MGYYRKAITARLIGEKKMENQNTVLEETLDQTPVVEATPINGRGLAFAIAGACAVASGAALVIVNRVKSKKAKTAEAEVKKPETTVEEVAA